VSIGLLHGVPRDLVEDAAVDGLAVERARVLQQFVEVPGNRLALAVGVGREVERVGLLHRARDRLDVLPVLVDQLPAHGEAAGGIDRAFLGHEVAHVAVGSHHLEVLAEVLLDGLRLGRRLDDDEIPGHVPCKISRAPETIMPRRSADRAAAWRFMHAPSRSSN
jgi:hypothetical protein